MCFKLVGLVCCVSGFVVLGFVGCSGFDWFCLVGFALVDLFCYPYYLVCHLVDLSFDVSWVWVVYCLGVLGSCLWLGVLCMNCCGDCVVF